MGICGPVVKDYAFRQVPSLPRASIKQAMHEAGIPVCMRCSIYVDSHQDPYTNKYYATALYINYTLLDKKTQRCLPVELSRKVYNIIKDKYVEDGMEVKFLTVVRMDENDTGHILVKIKTCNNDPHRNKK